jgi:hypothetical protein
MLIHDRNPNVQFDTRREMGNRPGSWWDVNFANSLRRSARFIHAAPWSGTTRASNVLARLSVKLFRRER